MERRRQNGLTLVEIMVAVGILVIVVAGVMESFVVNNRAYTVVDQTTETQQNSRAVGQLLEQDLRMTGFMVPEGAVACGRDSQQAGALASLLAGTDVLYVTNPDPIDPDGQSQASLGAPLSAGSGPTATSSTITLGDLTLEGRAYYDVDGNGAADSDFLKGGGVIVMDRSNVARGTACGVVRDIIVGTRQLIVDWEAGFTGSVGTLVAIPAHRYAVDTNNNLTRDGVSIVSDVEDLQIAYFIDSNDNGTADPNEYKGDGTSPNYNPNGTNHSDLREIRFDLVLRSRLDDPSFHDGAFQPSENREAVAGTDGFRRRELHTTVKPRNLGFRG